jgi:enoyl-CoA hydratase/carnithine racemase
VDQGYRTLRVGWAHEGVLSVVIDAPPMNLIGPELVRDLVKLLGEVESGGDVLVMVLESADHEYFVPHVDLTKVPEYTAEAAKAGGPEDASLGMLWHKLSELPAVTIAKLRGRARGAGSELALACDMRFAARENAVLGQPEVGFGTLPGAGGVQHLGRLLGRGRAMEAILGAADFDAAEAERYGWVNRALPDAELDAFVAQIARRIASFPVEGVRAAKRVLNELTLPGAEAIRADARRFQRLVVSDPVKARAAALFAQGLQTRGPLELDLGGRIGSLELQRTATKEATMPELRYETLILRRQGMTRDIPAGDNDAEARREAGDEYRDGLLGKLLPAGDRRSKFSSRTVPGPTQPRPHGPRQQGDEGTACNRISTIDYSWERWQSRQRPGDSG